MVTDVEVVVDNVEVTVVVGEEEVVVGCVEVVVGDVVEEIDVIEFVEDDDKVGVDGNGVELGVVDDSHTN